MSNLDQRAAEGQDSSSSYPTMTQPSQSTNSNIPDAADGRDPSSLRRRPQPSRLLDATGTKRDSVHNNGSAQQPTSQPPYMTTATLTPPLGQFVVNLLLQLAGIVAAIAFGIFAVESLNVAKQANIEAKVANQVAMVALCTQYAVRPRKS